MNCIGLLALTLSIVSARDVFRSPDVSSPSYSHQQQQDDLPFYDPFNFDSSDAASTKSVMHPPMIPHFPFGPFRNHGNEPSIFDAMHHHMKEIHRQVPLVPFFSKGFEDVPFLPSSGDEAHPPPAGPRDQGDFGGFFKKFFEGTFRDTMTPAINQASFDHLPPNYQNSTTQTHHIDGSKVVVNETTHKKSGDNFHQVYHFKVVQVSPHDQPEIQPDEQYESDTDTWEVKPEAESRRLPTEGRDDSLNDVIPSSADSYSVTNNGDSYDSNGLKVRRSIDVHGPPVEKEIQFPPEELNRFPHSMANNHLVPGGEQKDGKVSRSYVYRDQGGNSFLYSVDHKDLDGKKDFEKKDEPVYRDSDVERVGPIRPPDLSRDTRVNPDGRSTRQQGITLVDPDAEVFDLSLVIKEMESRANE